MPGPLCSSCGAAVSAGEAMRNPRLCPECRAAYDSAEARRARAVAERDERAHRIDGQPWWLCPRPQIVVRYTSFAQLSAEFDAATGHGWRVAQTDSTDGDANIGRYIIFGALALLSPATEGPITVTWERVTAGMGGPNADPVTALKQLRGMLDLALISEDEYNAKKLEILARL